MGCFLNFLVEIARRAGIREETLAFRCRTLPHVNKPRYILTR